MVKNLGVRTLVILAALGLSVIILCLRSPRYGIDLKGGSTLVYRIRGEGIAPTENPVDTSIRVMQRRLDPQGLQASTFRSLGKDQIEIQLAGADKGEVDRIKEKLTQLGKLEFRIVAEPDELVSAGINLDEENRKRQENEKVIAEAKEKGLLPPPAYTGPQPERYRWFYKNKQDDPTSGSGEFLKMEDQYHVSGEELASAHKTADQFGNAAVGFKLKPSAARMMGELTGANVHKRMAIVLNGLIETSPTIESQINDQGEITKPQGYDEKELKDLIDVLRAGSLPVTPELRSEATVGPTLGEEAIRLGYVASLIAAAAILLFMLIYYRLAGLIANLALVLNLIMLVAIMVFFQWTFTLPGIAGVVLTLGMAVDANILINERIREERAKGKTLIQALKNGYERATVTIIDANLTTIIAAIILWLVGTGPVQGFAITMTVGILVSMFTALFVTRTIFAFVAEGGFIKDLRMMQIFKRPNIDFFRIMKPAIAVSLAFMTLSLAVFFQRGPDKYGLDFTGGGVVQMSLKEPRTTGEIRTTLAGITTKDSSGAEVPKYPDIEVSAVGAGAQSLAEGTATQFEARTQVVPEQGQDEDAVVRAFQADVQTAFQDLLVPKGIVRPNDATGGLIPADTSDPALRELAGGYRFEVGVVGLVDAETLKRALVNAHFSPASDVKLLDQLEGFSRFSVVAKHSDPRVASDAGEFERAVSQALKSAGLRLPDPFPKVAFIGKTVVKDLQNKAIIAMALALVAMTVYIRVRFKHFNWGVAASFCLFHDVIISLGFLVFFDWIGLIHARIDLDSIAAFLTIVGYSINDTIVIFDRVRENLGKFKDKPLREVINLSVNETLGRTILTSLTVFLVVAVLFVVNYGRHSELEGLSFALLVGTIFGTYSTVYIASPIVIALEDYSARRKAIMAQEDRGVPAARS